MPVTVKNYAGNICKDNPRLFNILQVSFPYKRKENQVLNEMLIT